jgi:hypothetical protein
VNQELQQESLEIRDLLGMVYTKEPTNVDKVNSKQLVKQLAFKNDELKKEVEAMERVIEQLKSGRFALTQHEGSETQTLRRECE